MPPRTPEEALEEIRGLAAAGRIVLARHARERCRERGATFGDVREALARATDCRHQPAGRWRVTGEDLGGDELVLVVVIEDGVVVVTLF